MMGGGGVVDNSCISLWMARSESGSNDDDDDDADADADAADDDDDEEEETRLRPLIDLVNSSNSDNDVELLLSLFK